MSHASKNAKMNLDEMVKVSHNFVSELLSESPEPTESRKAVASTVAQVEATLAVARSIEYLAETLRDFGEAQADQ